MPEYAEVYTLTQDLQELVGLKLLDLRTDVALEYPVTLLKRVKIASITNRGKYIIFQFSNNYYLSIHLGMTGRLSFDNRQAGDKHLKLALKFKSKTLYFSDPRGFGKVIISDEPPKLGLIDPRDKGYKAHVISSIIGRSAPIFNLLLNQKIAFGVGSYLAQETLYNAHIRPEKRNLTKDEAEAVAISLLKVIKLAVKLKGASMKDYRLLNGGKGMMQDKFSVYGRAGEPCKKCSDLVVRVKIGGRSAYYCPNCQK